VTTWNEDKPSEDREGNIDHMTIKLGDIAKDTITGFQGVVTARTKWLSNVDRLTVNPQEVKDGKPISGRSFDETQLEYVGKSDVAIIPIERPAEPVELGDTVKHSLSGLEGVVTAITGWLEGCSIVQVQPRELKDGVPVDVSAFDERLLTILVRKTPRVEPVRTGSPRPEPRRW
jgi:hypothetical protein